MSLLVELVEKTFLSVVEKELVSLEPDAQQMLINRIAVIGNAFLAWADKKHESGEDF